MFYHFLPTINVFIKQGTKGTDPYNSVADLLELIDRHIEDNTDAETAECVWGRGKTVSTRIGPLAPGGLS